MTQDDREAIFVFSCENVDTNKLKQVLKKMPDAQLKQLRSAFKECGYDTEEPYKFDLEKPMNVFLFVVALAVIVILIMTLGNYKESGGGPM